MKKVDVAKKNIKIAKTKKQSRKARIEVKSSQIVLFFSMQVES